MKKHLSLKIISGIIIFTSTNLALADNVIKNETGKYGKPVKISVYTLHTKKWVDLAPNEEKSFYVNPNGESAHNDIVIWCEYPYTQSHVFGQSRDTGKIYISNIIRRPKNTYIYSNGKHLTWSWPENGGLAFETPNLQAKEIKEAAIETEVKSIENSWKEKVLKEKNEKEKTKKDKKEQENKRLKAVQGLVRGQ